MDFNQTFNEILAKRMALKEMLKAAKLLEPSEIRDATIAKIEIELLYFKLYLNYAF